MVDGLCVVGTYNREKKCQNIVGGVFRPSFCSIVRTTQKKTTYSSPGRLMKRVHSRLAELLAATTSWLENKHFHLWSTLGSPGYLCFAPVDWSQIDGEMTASWLVRKSWTVAPHIRSTCCIFCYPIICTSLGLAIMSLIRFLLALFQLVTFVFLSLFFALLAPVWRWSDFFCLRHATHAPRGAWTFPC